MKRKANITFHTLPLHESGLSRRQVIETQPNQIGQHPSTLPTSLSLAFLILCAGQTGFLLWEAKGLPTAPTGRAEIPFLLLVFKIPGKDSDQPRWDLESTQLMVVTIVPVPATQGGGRPRGESADLHLYSRQAQHSNTLLCWSHSNIKLFATMLMQSWQTFVLLRQNLHFHMTSWKL